jgi:uncharacterized protein
VTLRRFELSWDDRTVPACLEGPPGSDTGIVLAHGAGAGMGHPFMAGLRSRLASAGNTVLAFDYPYIADGRKAPDRLPVLVEAHRAAASHLAGRVGRIVLAGKSMGGRVGSHLDGFDECARVFYGYPLVPLGKKQARDTSHLDAITGPILFVQGERDRMAPLGILEPVVRRLGASLEVIPDADHGFKVPKRVGVTEDEVLDRLAEITVGWLGE